MAANLDRTATKQIKAEPPTGDAATDAPGPDAV
jgi:hypothetical protein